MKEGRREHYGGCSERFSAWPGCGTGRGGRCYSAGRGGSCCCCWFRIPREASGYSSAP